MNATHSRDPIAPPLRIAGVGASAGGISALEVFFGGVPAGLPVAFVVMQHLPRDRGSELPALLRRWCALPVHAAADGVAPACGCIYVPPPGARLTLQGGRFSTRPPALGPAAAGVDTIDGFFRSLAEDMGLRAIGIVLSGSGMDGAAGARRIKDAGGLVLVEDPATAGHADMPAAAIATGAADRVLCAAELGQELAARAWRLSPAAARAGGFPDPDPARVPDRILALIRERGGLDLTGYRPTPLLWRLQQRMARVGIGEVPAYEALLRSDPAELEALVRGIPIHVTEFFRDPPAWDALTEEVIAPLFRAGREADPIRVWTSACATGEEAYSAAILLAEQAEASGCRRDFRVFATDVSADIVARARLGRFPARALSGMSAQRVARFFERRHDGYRIRQSLRSKLVFAPQHLLADPPFSGMDLVTCRNLLIYLDGEAGERLLSLLHSSLRESGHLFLGSREPLPPRQCRFSPVVSRWRIFRKSTSDRAGSIPGYPSRPVRAARVNFAAAATDAPPVSGTDMARSEQRLQESAEELQASHQELRATSEELQSANDQLAAAYESLHEANGRLEIKVEELQTQRNVLSSGAVIALFLDLQLRVRWFTPEVDRLFPLLPGDVGRRITDLVARFEDGGFLPDARAVIEDGQLRERELHTRDGRWYLSRTRPYRLGTQTAGVAVTFTDITERRQAAEKLQQSEAHLQANLAGMRRLYELHAKLTRETDLRAALQEILATAAHFAGTDRAALHLLGAGGSSPELAASRGYGQSPRAREYLRQQGFRQCCEAVGRERTRLIIADTRDFPQLAAAVDGEQASLHGIRSAHLTPVISRRDELIGVLSTQHDQPRRPTQIEGQLIDLLAWTAADFIERHRAYEALRMSEQWLRQTLNTPGVCILTFEAASGVLLDANDAFFSMFGYGRHEVESRSLTWRALTPPEHVASSEAQLADMAGTGRIGPYEKEYLRRDGSRAWMLLAGARIGDGKVVEFCIDVGDRKRAEEALRQAGHLLTQLPERPAL